MLISLNFNLLIDMCRDIDYPVYFGNLNYLIHEKSHYNSKNLT